LATGDGDDPESASARTPLLFGCVRVPGEPTAGRERYAHVRDRLAHLLDGEDDWIAALATIACELHAAFDAFDWTGFYRVAQPGLLIVGPYQGGHGCLRIPFSRGVCGAAARTLRTQRVDDVATFPGHIACSSATRSEIVVPVVSPGGSLLAVLDVDSDQPAAFTEEDRIELERICADLAARFPEGEATGPGRVTDRPWKRA
jgi:L-methionine (R)-S-oxide reductase